MTIQSIAPAAGRLDASVHIPGSKSITNRALLLAALASTAIVVVSQNARREQVGPLPGGGFLLNTGWKLQPAPDHACD